MSLSDITTKINKAIRAAYIINSDGEIKPIVCLVCDRFVKPDKVALVDIDTLKKHRDLLATNPDNNVHPRLQQQYTLQITTAANMEDVVSLENCMLSPRSSYVHNDDNRKSSGYTICNICKNSLSNKTLPLYSIANNYAFGETPSVLRNLTQIELAMVTPVKTFGYCFSYTGGLQKQLKGSLSYYKISHETIVRTGAQFEGLGLNNHVVILLYGTFTKEQKKRVQQKYEINTRRIIKAISWLVKHNTNWIPYASMYTNIISQLKTPILYDDSTIASMSINHEEEDKFNESIDSFQVFYPDGTVSLLTGGQQNTSEFQEVLQNATKSGFQIEFKMQILSEAVHDYKGDNLVNACLLQFPYGRGGLNEFRMNKKGESTQILDIAQFTEYISMLSLPQFHSELFTLQIYNMQTKYIMVKSAGWKIRHKLCARLLGLKITKEDIYDAIENTRNATGRYGRGDTFLGAIDAICKTIPHTNEAARIARRNIETMQHHYGCPTFFLTVTPDDDNHILVQIYAGTICSENKDINMMSDEEVAALAKQKTELRIKFPGVCAYFFEIVMDIVLRDVIKWDKSKNGPIGDTPGIFGNISAMSMSIEEQGRRTLHAHILLWVNDLNNMRTELYSSNKYVVRNAAKIITTKIDNICSSKMFFNGFVVPHRQATLQRIFTHQCLETDHQEPMYPTSVSDQQLRNLRCRQPLTDAAASCQACKTDWCTTRIVTSYLQNFVKVSNIGDDYSANARRLKNLATQFQLESLPGEQIQRFIVDAAYNHHVHTPSCFKHKTDQYNKAALCEECRYKYPKRPKRTTIIQESSPIKQPWFLWNGSNKERYVKEIHLKRSEYDIFQNNCCPQISYSNLTCNTNLSFILPGPVAHYCIGYTMKNTQKDEGKEYEFVRAASEKILSKVKDDDTCEAVAFRRLLSATFAHQSNNIVGAAMAAYLTRNKSRFYFSHSFAWCPLRDITNLLNGENVNAAIAINENSAYFHCEALHYLCRPTELEDVPVFKFYSQYEVCKQTENNKDSVYTFHNTSQFKHPSFDDLTNTCLQGVRPRKIQRLAKVYQHDFPDTAMFEGNILDYFTPINDYMEQYSFKVLLLFLPIREKQDMLLDNSYTKKLRQVVLDNKFDSTVFQFLQNIQDTKANNLRNSLTQDDLQRNTNTPDLDNTTPRNQTNDDNSEDQISVTHLNQLAQQMEDLQHYIDDTATTSAPLDSLPTSYNCAVIRKRGRFKCGSTKLPNFLGTRIPVAHDFVTNTFTPLLDDLQETHIIHRLQPNQTQLTQILITHQGLEQRSFGDITGQQQSVSVCKPNGSARSIIDWARKSKLDTTQQRAFEIIAASFVLSYYDPTVPTRHARHSYSAEKTRLRTLLHNNMWSNNQLVCFLHGPAGSGKTALIDLVILYAKQFCSYIWSDFQSFERVIVVTAMTGVAATLLQGETTHSALYLNQKRTITPEQIQLWSGTKMVIIDEISFADKHDIAKIQNQLCRLKQQNFLRYGGINIIFSGDLRQLEPVGRNKKPLYDDNTPEFLDWINCYIELNGIWRFKDDPAWGKLLMRLRNGEFSTKDLATVNTNISANQIIPPQIRYACYFNKDRDAINTAFFEQRLKYCFSRNNYVTGFLLVFSDNILMKNYSNVYKPFSNCTFFWETIGENDIKVPIGSARMDPVLKLYPGCKVMLPTNINVSKGLANGTQATVHKILLKEGVFPSTTTMHTNISVPCVFASQIEYIELLHTNKRIQPPTFSVTPKNHTFKVKLPSMTHFSDTTFLAEMKATQLPLLHNNATTGHKLQGAGVDQLFVHKWSAVTNWSYVMLSRVKTLNGLFARDTLPDDMTLYALKPAYRKMIHNLSEKKPSPLTNQQYNLLLNN